MEKKAKNQIFMTFVHDNGCRPHKRPHKGHKGSVLYMVMAVGGLLRPSGRIPLGPCPGCPEGPWMLCWWSFAPYWQPIQGPSRPLPGLPGGPQEEKREKTQKKNFFSTSTGRSS